MIFPAYVQSMIEKLRDAGFTAYAVGGCVRDTFLGRTPNDWDVTTSAKPEETMAVFSDAPFTVYAANGLKHGTVTVSLDGESCEITTYRTEGTYSDHRRPDEVHFVTDIRDDLSRRDFTVNAMAAAPRADGSFDLVDPFGGREDLAAGLLRAVGDPVKRFTEDALRILRGIRFASRYGFTVDPDTARAMHECAPLLEEIAPERIGDEMRGILKAPHCKRILTQFEDIAGRLFPACSVSLLPVGNASLTARLSCLLAPLSPEEAERLLLHYAFGSSAAKTVSCFLRFREAELARHDVRCAVADQIGRENMDDFFAFRRALAPADTALVAHKSATLALFADGVCYNTATLAVRGADLLVAGIPASPKIGQILAALTRDVIAGKYKNDRDTLLRAAIADYSSVSSVPSD
ncbi:MAG: tRNA nucleotidyltransferase [Clostridia bacterium]|nr:tRNA nucleotidyltransferase [Clostridia bacterium]